MTNENPPFDANSFIREFQDYCVPLLDMYEQAIYLYIVRHSRLVGQNEAVIGFKSARKKLAFGIGKAGTPPSEDVCYKKSRSLHEKGLIEIIASERSGTRLRVFLPNEVSGMVPPEHPKSHSGAIDLEKLDFFNDPDLRLKILERENRRCFYCHSKLNEENYVLEHVVSRPEGDNTFKNLVAACRRCNNRKSDGDVHGFLRILYREELLSEEEFAERISALEQLKLGKLRPQI